MTAVQHRQTILQVLDQLPPLHKVAQKLIALMNDDRSSARDLDRLIRNDQALTARILKMANSAAYGKSREIFQLTEAVVLLGHTTLTNLVLGSTVQDVVSTNQDDEFWEQAWAHSLDCAAMAQALAELTGSAPPENAFVAGLLHDIGLLVQAQAVPEVLREVIASQPADALAAERQAMGLNHAQIGLKLLDLWCLPIPICEAVRYHHTPKRKYQRTNPLINIVALADRLTAMSGNEIFASRNQDSVFRLLRDVGVTTAQFKAMFRELDRSQKNVRCLMEDAQLSDRNLGPIENPELPPVHVYAIDEKRQAWYAAVLAHFGVRTLDGRELVSGKILEPATPHIVVDFAGMSPAERSHLSESVFGGSLNPIVVGDRRHTPASQLWQQAAHLPELFTREEVSTVFVSHLETTNSP